MHLLIIRPGALGDTLMLLPALMDLSGKVTITFVGRQPGLEFIRPHVDRAMDLEASGWHRLFMTRPDRGCLPVEAADAVAAFFSDRDGVIKGNLRSCFPHASVHVFPSFPPKGEDVHVALYLGRCLKSAGLPVDPVRSVTAIKAGILPQRVEASEGRRKMVFHPGSGSQEKNYPTDFWVELIERCRRDDPLRGLPRVLLLGPAEALFYARFMENLQPGDAEIVSSSAVKTLTEILGKAAICIGHDSGVTHLFAMNGVPTVALFRNSDPNQWAPLGPSVRVIQEKAPGPELPGRILDASRSFLGVNR